MVELVEARGPHVRGGRGRRGRGGVHVPTPLGARWRQAGEEERRTRVCLADRRSRPSTQTRNSAARGRTAICELRGRTGWGPPAVAGEVASISRTRRCTGRCGGAAARVAPARSARPRSATSGPAPATCCTWTPSARPLRAARPRGHRRPHPTLARGRLEFVHSIVDDCSRLAYTEIHDDERADTVTAFTGRALDWFLEQGIVTERMLTDNALGYTQNARWGRCWGGADPAHAHPALLAAHQRQGGAPAADDGSGVGPGAQLPIERRSAGGAATLARPLQREPSSLSSRQPPAYGSRSGRLGARHLALRLPAVAAA